MHYIFILPFMWYSCLYHKSLIESQIRYTNIKGKLPAVLLHSIRATVCCLTTSSLTAFVRLYVLSYYLKSFSPFFCSLLFVRLFNSLSIKPWPLHADWTLSLFSIFSLPLSLTYTLFLYSSFLLTGFFLLSFSLATKIPSIPLFHSPSLSFSRSFSNFLIVFNLVSLLPLFPSTILLLFSYLACSLSIVIHLFSGWRSSQKRSYLFSKKKAVIPFQVWYRNHSVRFSI